VKQEFTTAGRIDSLGRRELIAMIGSAAAAAWTGAAHAQVRARLVAVMVPGIATDPESQTTIGTQLAAFRDELASLGWVDGKNLRIETRQSNDDVSALQSSTRDLVALKPDVLVVYSPPGLVAAMEATKTIPIVFHTVPDPVGAGFVASLAHPGGNATGFTNLEPTMAGKWVQLLKEIAPGIKTVAMLINPAVNSHRQFRAAAEAAAATVGVASVQLIVTDQSQIGPAIDGLGGKEGCGLVVFPSNIVTASETLVVTHAALQRLPAIYSANFFVAGGGLISYGPDERQQFRDAATYVARILNGEKPADLPVQAPTKFDLTINLKTARTLGLTVPQTLLATADEVIE
jgi:putative tryptophan/tyrosine transport system substrate-binding protein